MKYTQPEPQDHKETIANLKIAIVSAGLSHLGEEEANHSKLVRATVAGATEKLTALGVNIDDHLITIECPGVLEIPLMAEKIITKHKVDGVLGAALIVNGGLYRHEFVAQSSLDALMNVSLKTGVPIASSLLTPVQPKSPETQFDVLHSHLHHKGEEGAEALVRQILQFARI